MKETIYKITACPISFAIIADTHNGPYKNIITSLKRHKPQMIAIAGDIILGRIPESGLAVEKQENVLPLLSECREIAPTYLSLGNHEHFLCSEDYSKILETGVKLLDNSFCEKDGIVIGGLTSGHVMSYRRFRNSLNTSKQYPDPKEEKNHQDILADKSPDTSWLEAYANTPGYHILLCHHPEYIDLIPASVELIVSGHAHGGQWNYYSLRDHRWRGVFAPGQGLFPRYTSGIHNHRLIVSRGLCNTTWIPRICNPTEIVYIS